MVSLIDKLQPLWANPVIVKDMRVRMRGTRAVWNQGLYLLLLCIITFLGYSFSAQSGQANPDPVAAQQNLHQFYNWIFEALAALITIIAPALTAVSIISEKKMQTLDLLVTTPMTSMQMLSGKLISSIAFILLLLALSFPLSALCIILGGATISDVWQSYILLAIDGIVMTAVGLAFSCIGKQHSQAIVGTYGAILLLLFLTYFIGITTTQATFRAISSSHGDIPALAALSELNPFFVAAYPGFNVSIIGLSVPVWLATLVAGVIIVRLLLTGAALRLGMYGVGLVGSLRRQILGVTLLLSFVLAQGERQIVGNNASNDLQITMVLQEALVFLVALVFLPSLLVPVVQEDGSPGQIVKGSYSLSNAFGTKHSGSLPYFQIWLFCMIAASFAGTLCPSGQPISTSNSGSGVDVTAATLWKPLLTSAASMYVYLTGAGALYWSLARRSSWLSTTAQTAGTLSFFLLVIIGFIPLAAMIAIQQINLDENYNAFAQSSVRFFWVLYPLEVTNTYESHGVQRQSMLEYGLAMAALGCLIYPFWWDVIPGAKEFGIKRSRTTNVP